MIVLICIILCFWGYLLWNKPKMVVPQEIQTVSEMVSVLIAFRNEEEHIHELLEALDRQTYITKAHIQLIFINDHSEDDGARVIQDWSKGAAYKVSLLKLSEKQGKKAALRYGVQYALSNTLLFTDADCLPHEYWMHQMINRFKAENTDLLIGTVWYRKSKRLFNRLQELEFAVLQAITALSIKIGWPFMCNGANLMTKKTVYSEYLLQENTQHISSGDDVFYLEYLIKTKKRIGYANSPWAYVSTSGENILSQFIQQRLRWSAKLKYYKNPNMLFPSMIFTLWSLGIIGILLMILWFPLWYCILILVLKFIIDYIVVYTFYKGFNRRFLNRDLFPLAIIYPVYVFSIGFLSFFKTFTWKNRHARA